MFDSSNDVPEASADGSGVTTVADPLPTVCKRVEADPLVRSFSSKCPCPWLCARPLKIPLVKESLGLT